MKIENKELTDAKNSATVNMSNVYWNEGNEEGRLTKPEYSDKVKALIGTQKCVVDVPNISFNPKVKDWIVDPNPGTHQLKITSKKESK